MSTPEPFQNMADLLEKEHRKNSFKVLEPRANLGRVMETARQVGLVAVPFRGGLSFLGSEADHVWAGVGENPEELYPVDVAYPVKDERFLHVLRLFVGDGTKEQRKKLKTIASEAPFDQRIIGPPPANAPYRYMGKPMIFKKPT